MNAVPLHVGVALVTLLFTNAYAQSGESGAPGIAAEALERTPEQQAADKVARHDAATLAAREAVRGEAGASPPWLRAQQATAQRDQAVDERRRNAAQVYASGEAHGGEAGP